MTRRPPSFPPSARPVRAPGPAAGGVVVTERHGTGAPADDAAEVATGTDSGTGSRAGDTAVDVRGGRAELISASGSAGASRVSDGLSDRLAERRRARRRLRWRTLVAAAVAAVLLGGGGWVALVSPLLALRPESVAVVGSDDIAPAAQVLAAVAPFEGQPLLRLDTGAVRDAVLAVPGVLDARVSRDLPHGLEVTVTPREPVATVSQDGAFVLLDPEGVELARTDAAREGVPVVQVPVGTSGTAAALAAVLAALAALADGDLLGQVATASASSAHEVELTLVSGGRVVWGSADDSALKTAVLASLLAVDAEVYDVSAPLSPITR